ncbi:MAG: hypothetical protein IT364_19430, partial [Candidatus Hydrogenedentes bacterium]|nr:hypothetical protein [Candidatus Hydrogenedentota bacterium]
MLNLRRLSSASSILPVCLLTLALLPCLAWGEPLLAGVAVSNITPDTTKYHVPLGGYGARQNAAALGVHDTAMAKA